MCVAIDAKKCYVTGRGVQQYGVRVGDSADFVVHTDGAGDGDLAVMVEGPGGAEEPVRVNKVLLGVLQRPPSLSFSFTT